MTLEGPVEGAPPRNLISEFDHRRRLRRRSLLFLWRRWRCRNPEKYPSCSSSAPLPPPSSDMRFWSCRRPPVNHEESESEMDITAVPHFATGAKNCAFCGWHLHKTTRFPPSGIGKSRGSKHTAIPGSLVQLTQYPSRQDTPGLAKMNLGYPRHIFGLISLKNISCLSNFENPTCESQESLNCDLATCFVWKLELGRTPFPVMSYDREQEGNSLSDRPHKVIFGQVLLIGVSPRSAYHILIVYLTLCLES